MVFKNNRLVVYGLFCTMIVTNIVMLLMGLLGIRLFSKVVGILKLASACDHVSGRFQFPAGETDHDCFPAAIPAFCDFAPPSSVITRRPFR